MQSVYERKETVFGTEREVLNDIEASLATLKNTAVTIDVELDYQNELIKETGNEVDEANGIFERLGRKLKKIRKNSGSCKCYLIIGLGVTIVTLALVLILG